MKTLETSKMCNEFRKMCNEFRKSSERCVMSKMLLINNIFTLFQVDKFGEAEEENYATGYSKG